MSRIFLFIILFFLLSCNGKNHIPENIIKQREMEAIMWDMIKADNLALQRVRYNPTLDKNKEDIALLDTVFDIHKIRKSDFDRGLTFYQDHPEMMKIILDSIRSFSDKPIKNIKDTSRLKIQVDTLLHSAKKDTFRLKNIDPS